jgi:hypothetical protein
MEADLYMPLHLTPPFPPQTHKQLTTAVKNATSSTCQRKGTSSRAPRRRWA